MLVKASITIPITYNWVINFNNPILIIHLIFNVKEGLGRAPICYFNVQGLRCHSLQVILKVHKLLYNANRYLLSHYFIVVIINTLVCSENSFTVYCTFLLVIYLLMNRLAHSKKIAYGRIAKYGGNSVFSVPRFRKLHQ